ncbi:DUF4304 domain-containing protein [Psychroflexus aestuariivivens]|uniref:DUF4304 domain-containing protein n=1 Tax=Psychroflexus aestuariivivens TaxID=1795040 RepID=UPI000FD76E99|nr:DUF4304 domain-containing protein [Psychroflexus aestuariivivens]
MIAINQQLKIREEVLNPLLKAAGFSNDGEMWWKSYDEFSLVLNIQNYWWSTDDQVDFRINLGLMIPPIKNAIEQKPELTDLAVCVSQDCFMKENRQFHKFKNSIGYTIKTTDDYQDVSEFIKKDLIEEILPKFFSQNTLEKCINFYKEVPFWNNRLERLILEQKFRSIQNMAC